MPKLLKFRVTLIGGTLAVLAGTPALAVFWDNRVVEGVNHFVECWSYMWTDEQAHIDKCSPNVVGPYLIEDRQNYAPLPVTVTSSSSSVSSSSSIVVPSSSSVPSTPSTPSVPSVPSTPVPS